MILLCMEYVINITVASTLSEPCSQILIQTADESKYEYDNMTNYMYQYIFGVYRFESIDARGNHIYHADVQNREFFIYKNAINHWVVRIIH